MLFFISRVFTTHYKELQNTRYYCCSVWLFCITITNDIFTIFHWKKTRKLYKANFPLHRLDKENSGIYETSSDISVTGNIKHFEHFWDQKLKKASNFSMEIIRNGYSLLFENIPPPFCAQNNKSSLKEKRFVEESIKILLDSLHKPSYSSRKIT